MPKPPKTPNLESQPYARLGEVETTEQLEHDRVLVEFIQEQIEKNNIKATDKMLLLLKGEFPTMSPAEMGKLLNMTTASVNYRLAKPGFQKAYDMLFGSFAQRLIYARNLGLNKMIKVIHEGSDKDAIEATKVLEVAFNAMEARKAEANEGVRYIDPKTIPRTNEEIIKRLQADPINRNPVIDVKPLED